MLEFEAVSSSSNILPPEASKNLATPAPAPPVMTTALIRTRPAINA